MQKALIVLLCTAAICSASLTVSEQCIQDVEALLPVVEQIVQDAEARDWVAIVGDVTAAAGQIREAAADCLETTISAEKLGSSSCTNALVALLPDIEAIYKDASSGNYVQLAEDILSAAPAIEAAASACGVEMLISISSTCEAALESLLPDILTIAQDIQDKDYAKVAEDVIKAGEGIKSAAQACGVSLALEESCTEALVALLPAVEAIVEDIREEDFEQLIQDVTQVLPQVQEATSACGLIEEVGSISEECSNALLTLLPYALKILEYASEGKVVKLGEEIKTSIPYFQAVVSDCKASDELFLSKRNLQSAQCLTDLEGLIPGLQQLVEDAESGDYWALAKDVLELITPLETAYGDCFE